MSEFPSDQAVVRGRSLHSRLRTLLVCGLAVGLPWVVLGLALVHFGSLAAVMASVRGDEIYVESLEVVLNSVKPGESVDARFVFGNLGSRESTILSVRPSCDCVTVLPASRVVKPGGRLDLPIRLSSSPDFRGTDVIKLSVYLDSLDEVVELRLRVIYSK